MIFLRIKSAFWHSKAFFSMCSMVNRAWLLPMTVLHVQNTLSWKAEFSIENQRKKISQWLKLYKQITSTMHVPAGCRRWRPTLQQQYNNTTIPLNTPTAAWPWLVTGLAGCLRRSPILTRRLSVCCQLFSLVRTLTHLSVVMWKKLSRCEWGFA